jgi:hypothetical protein
MPIVLALLAGFFIGVAFAWIARAELGRVDAPLVATRPFNVVLGFTALVYAPLVAYFVGFHGDWMYGYAIAWHQVPSAVDLALVILAACTILLGMAASAHAARARRLAIVAWLGVTPAVVFAVVLALGASRLSVSATYAQYHGGFGVVPVSSSALGRGILLMAVVLILGLAWTVRALQLGANDAERVLGSSGPIDE